MDKSNLIDFNNENFYKLASPLIPAPNSLAPRLSDIASNPFDKICRTITNMDDPFDCIDNSPTNNNKSFTMDDKENQENVGSLISPLQTPAKAKKHKKFTSHPLFLTANDSSEETIKDGASSQLRVISELQNSSMDCNTSNISLQCLSDSFLNSIDVNLAESFSVALNCPLPETPEKIILLNTETISSKSSVFNNAFMDSRVPHNYKFSDIYDNDSVFLEANHLAEVCRDTPSVADVDISTFTAPWLEEKIDFFDSDEDESDEKGKPALNNENSPIATVSNKSEVEESEDKKENSIHGKEEFEQLSRSLDSDLNEKDVEPDVQNARDILHNLTAILKNSGNIVDKRQLGESLLNSLALALNLETPIKSEDQKNSNKLQRSKSDSKLRKYSLPILTLPSKENEKKLPVPKLKIQPATPLQLEKNLKPKMEKEKEKVSTRGPLKALIPLTNMAKKKRNVAPYPVTSNITPPKNSQFYSMFQVKKTSTPNELKINPLAQSTPDSYTNKTTSEQSKTTPISKRKFGFSISPLARPSSISDISKISLNKSISPRNTSDINVNNLNKSGSKSPANSSIPSIKNNASMIRRNSSGDLNASNKSTLNHSYDSGKPARPSLLKRSSSFQSKATVVNTASAQSSIKNSESNNNVKKYGQPGKIKSLKLVPKMFKKTPEN